MKPHRYSLGSFDTVAISKRIKHKCSVRKCRCKTGYMVFTDDGAPKMSRYTGTFCKKHLEKGITKAWEYNIRKGDY
jgi:hypothetical protein